MLEIINKGIETIVISQQIKENQTIVSALPGPKGEPGDDGYTPIKGVDYFDGIKGDDGYTPIKGIDYFDGLPGPKGENSTVPGPKGENSTVPGPKGEDGSDATITKLAVENVLTGEVSSHSHAPQVFIQDSAPVFSGVGIWVQTGLGTGDDFTFWFEDGE